ncbi:MAG: hypothetical protein P0S96_03215 [Simkaniaceae bacterium]|nr:hypothetical protein [Candidatus Sacchlamyda saccharinae]
MSIPDTPPGSLEPPHDPVPDSLPSSPASRRLHKGVGEGDSSLAPATVTDPAPIS